MSELIIDAKAWKNEPMTDKQASFISVMEEYRFDAFPKFSGTTKGEANQYITRYRKVAYANLAMAGRCC
jgi:hypothetical protein